MRRPSKSSSNRLTAESQRLVALAKGQLQASSRLEERQWEQLLDATLSKLLKTSHQDTVDAALEHLFKTELAGYDVLMEATEAASESCSFVHDDVTYDALLIAAPVLAWTRFAIASGPIPEEARQALAAQLHGHILADDACLALSPLLYSIDQLPRTHAETYALTQRLAQAAVKAATAKAPAQLAETAPFLADTRYLLGVVAVPRGASLFRWQISGQSVERVHALEQWRAQAGPTVLSLLPGCGVELLLPEAYYVACREADKHIRPISIRAAVHYLVNTLGIEAGSLRAIVAGFSENPLADGVDEYRIAFTLRQEAEVIYGVVWPLYGQEDGAEESISSFEGLTAPESLEDTMRTPLEEIIALLRACGITHIKRHAERFPLEFCEDCGAPLYADAEAELVHPEMPEDVPAGGGHFH